MAMFNSYVSLPEGIVVGICNFYIPTLAGFALAFSSQAGCAWADGLANFGAFRARSQAGGFLKWGYPKRA